MWYVWCDEAYEVGGGEEEGWGEEYDDDDFEWWSWVWTLKWGLYDFRGIGAGLEGKGRAIYDAN